MNAYNYDSWIEISCRWTTCLLIIMSQLKPNNGQTKCNLRVYFFCLFIVPSTASGSTVLYLGFEPPIAHRTSEVNQGQLVTTPNDAPNGRSTTEHLHYPEVLKHE